MKGLLTQNSSECHPCFENGRFSTLEPWAFSSGCNFIFVEVYVRARWGAPLVRSLRKNGVNLYRRTPQAFLLAFFGRYYRLFRCTLSCPRVPHRRSHPRGTLFSFQIPGGKVTGHTGVSLRHHAHLLQRVQAVPL